MNAEQTQEAVQQFTTAVVDMQAKAVGLPLYSDLAAAMTRVVKFADSEPDGGQVVGMRRVDVERCRKLLDGIGAADGLKKLPPSDWDEWAMHRARRLADRIQMTEMPEATLINVIHCALLDAMEYVT